MKITSWLIIGVFILASLAVPVIAATENRENVGRQTASVRIPGPAADQAPVAGVMIVPKGYFYMFNHGANCNADLNVLPMSIVFSSPTFEGYYMLLNNTGSATQTVGIINCPQSTVASFTGKHPLIRYGMIEYLTAYPEAKIKRITFYNGKTFIKNINENAYSIPNGARMELTWDLGEWYDFSRGMNQIIMVYNTDASYDNYILIGGYGARGDWA